MSSRLESKNLSIMLTDLHGYSEFSANSSRSEIASLIKTHSDLLRPVIDFYKGRVIKTLGDSFLCAFESATDASVCAIAVLMIVSEYNQRQRDDDKKLTIRVMISSGDVTLEEGDIYGEAVNLVSRMEKLDAFKKGGIGISESTYLLMNRQEITAEEVGEHSFKGIGHPIRVYRIPLEKQKLSKLPSKLLDLVKRVAEGGPVPAPPKTAQPRRLDPRFAHFAVGAATVVLVLTVVFVGVVWKRNQKRIARMAAVMNAVQAADPDRDGTIYRKDYKGPESIFRSLDANRDDVVTPDEMLAWADELGIQLPPPARDWLSKGAPDAKGEPDRAPAQQMPK